MEIDHPQNYEQIVSNSDDQGREEQVRAYNCTFCQRGFSNAQALGGHMNIHRKDRARLKDTEEERLIILSVDMARKNPLIHPQPSADKFKLSQLESSEDKDCTLERPLSSLSGEGNISPPGMEKLQQLSLFSEKPSQRINDEKARCYGTGGHGYGHGHDENINIRRSHRGGSSQKEILDLELRLGSQPHKASASIIQGFNQ